MLKHIAFYYTISAQSIKGRLIGCERKDFSDHIDPIDKASVGKFFSGAILCYDQNNYMISEQFASQLWLLVTCLRGKM